MMRGSILFQSGGFRGRRSLSRSVRTGLVLLLGCASGSAVEAKDRPRPDVPASQKSCEWAGPGFAKIEGSETCVKIGGSVRADVSSTSGGRVPWK